MSDQNLAGNDTSIRETVREAYSKIAVEQTGCCGPTNSCCGGDSSGEVAKSVGYSDAELATLEVDDAVPALVPTAAAACRNPALVVTSTGLGDGTEQRLLRLIPGDVGKVRYRAVA